MSRAASLGGHVRRQVTAAVGAPGAHRGEPAGAAPDLGRGVRVGSAAMYPSSSVVGQAVDGGAGAGAARVEADDVEGVADRPAEGEVGVLGVVGAGRAGAAGVDHQVARAVAVGGVLEQRELDRFAGRVVVVERHLDGRALVAGAAGLPGQLLVVERLERGVGRVLPARGGGRRLRRGGGAGRLTEGADSSSPKLHPASTNTDRTTRTVTRFTDGSPRAGAKRPSWPPAPRPPAR